MSDVYATVSTARVLEAMLAAPRALYTEQIIDSLQSSGIAPATIRQILDRLTDQGWLALHAELNPTAPLEGEYRVSYHLTALGRRRGPQLVQKVQLHERQLAAVLGVMLTQPEAVWTNRALANGGHVSATVVSQLVGDLRRRRWVIGRGFGLQQLNARFIAEITRYVTAVKSRPPH